MSSMSGRRSKTKGSLCRRPCPGPTTTSGRLALVSFSTGFEQRNVDKVQRALDALADAAAPRRRHHRRRRRASEIAAPANAIVLDYAAHDPILRAPPSSLAMAATARRCGRCATACRWRSFPASPATSPTSPLRSTNGAPASPCLPTPRRRRSATRSTELIAEPRYRAEARRRAEALAGVDGASAAADEVEATLAN